MFVAYRLKIQPNQLNIQVHQLKNKSIKQD